MYVWRVVDFTEAAKIVDDTTLFQSRACDILDSLLLYDNSLKNAQMILYIPSLK